MTVFHLSLNNLKNLLQDDFEKTMISYLKDAEESVRIIRHSYTRSDIDTLLSHAHMLSGLSGSIGAEHLSILCRKIEYEYRSFKLFPYLEHIRNIEHEHNIICDNIREFMKCDN